MNRPTQAVVLAGGRGTRLRPLTDHRPKPMIEFHRKPFLEYLVEMLREQGFRRVLMLLGYLPEVIQDYFGDGSRWGIKIEYSVSGVEDDTGRRLKLAESRIDPIFLLMYCDNYWPMCFDKMWQQYASKGVPALVTVYRNSDQYTRDNLRVDEDGDVVTYDKSRTAPDLRGVDIGFAILRHEVLDLLPDENVSFERVVYPQLVEQRQLQAFVTEHRYYSVGSPERLHLTNQFLACRPAVILDRDGVLNKKPPQAHYVRSWEEFKWLPRVIEALRLLKQAGYRLIVVTNQPGIARGMMTEADLATIHERMQAVLASASVTLDAIYYCPHGWDEECECRKPKPGLLFQAQRDFHLDLTKTVFIGDDERDLEAGRAAGCPTFLVSSEMSLLDCVRKHILSGGPVRQKQITPV